MENAILLIHSDKEEQHRIGTYLQIQGIDLTTAPGLKDGIPLAIKGTYAMILMDIDLADGDALWLCEALRLSGKNTPVVLIVDDICTYDLLSAQKMGANEAINRPVNLPSIVHQLRCVRLCASTLCLYSGGLMLNRNTQRVHLNGLSIHLTQAEYCLLVLMMQRKCLLTREQIIKILHRAGIYEIDQENLGRTMHHLRKKIGEDRIQAQRRKGYLWVE